MISILRPSESGGGDEQGAKQHLRRRRPRRFRLRAEDRRRLNAVSADRIARVAEASRFPSREAIPRRPPRIHRTGRTMQFNARATPETVEAFYAIADRQGWLVSETLEHALAALQRELAGAGQGITEVGG